MDVIYNIYAEGRKAFFLLLLSYFKVLLRFFEFEGKVGGVS